MPTHFGFAPKADLRLKAGDKRHTGHVEVGRGPVIQALVRWRLGADYECASEPAHDAEYVARRGYSCPACRNQSIASLMPSA
jgi:hypothetical protein